ncbi:MAG: helix-turn-helix domain-containing protein [Gammaproteobacteria bacterium]|nr:helix-turn-helix domain-containing protein [Gammaproteobacteria bacterium]MBU1654639.1 helix-turn-helix domain-containing protein [Gammaproteobacteria bacterium]MBU1960432.1 helix-turn-helix domain-containing protein [Gammaproteobacteria bacterium]
MVMNEKALIERDSERDVWQETLDAVRDIKAGKVGRVETVELLPVVEARQKSGLSQTRFAELLGVSVRTLQDWEQGRRKPSKAAMSLIQIAKQRPDVLHEVFG